jgi:trehalose-6-phosphate synthase
VAGDFLLVQSKPQSAIPIPTPDIKTLEKHFKTLPSRGKEDEVVRNGFVTTNKQTDNQKKENSPGEVKPVGESARHLKSSEANKQATNRSVWVGWNLEAEKASTESKKSRPRQALKLVAVMLGTTIIKRKHAIHEMVASGRAGP